MCTECRLHLYQPACLLFSIISGGLDLLAMDNNLCFPPQTNFDLLLHCSPPPSSPSSLRRLRISKVGHDKSSILGTGKFVKMADNQNLTGRDNNNNNNNKKDTCFDSSHGQACLRTHCTNIDAHREARSANSPGRPDIHSTTSPKENWP